MAKRKSINYYKERGIRTPTVAYILDRSYMYLPVLAVALLAMVAIVAAGVRDLNAMAAPPEVDSPYRETEPRDFLGKQFAADLVAQHPDGIDADDWEAESDPIQPHPIYSVEQCPDLGTAPNSLLTTYRGAGDGLRVDTFIFGAGQAKRYFEDVGSILENCDDVSDYNEGTVSAEHNDASYDLDYYEFSDNSHDYTVLTAGDAIFEIRAADDAGASDSEARDFYADYTVESMNREQWRCENIEVDYDDYTRSFFHDFSSYEGYFETESLEAQTPIDNLPSPVLTRNGNDEAENSIQTVNTPNLNEPEAPLPEDFDDLPENEPERPQLPLEFEPVDEFADTAYYEIPDRAGPGCGWEWAAQISPVYDEIALENNREVVRTQVQSELEESANQYVDSGVDYALRTLLEEPVITRWNQHVGTVNAIHEDWTWLEEQRDALWPAWRDYIAAHEEWAAFPGIQEEAREEYNAELDEFDDIYAEYEEELEQCEAQRDLVDQWDEYYAEAVQDGDAVIEGEDNIVEEYDEEAEEIVERELPEVPERPDDCLSLPSEPSEPERPAILDEDRGPEPQPPSVPEGVTVPESWEDPAN